jgi:hypothetical protein
MKNKTNLEALIYVAVVALSLIALTLGFLSYQFTDTKVVYGGF